MGKTRCRKSSSSLDCTAQVVRPSEAEPFQDLVDEFPTGSYFVVKATQSKCTLFVKLLAESPDGLSGGIRRPPLIVFEARSKIMVGE